MCSARALCLSVFLWVVPSASTQSFAEPAYAHLPRVDRDVDQVVIIDLDADGDLDALVTDRSAAPGVRLWRNDGHARLREENLAWSNDPGPCTAVAVGDLDGDGHRDIALGTGFASDQILLGWNDGSPRPRFTLSQVSGLQVDVLDLDLVDIDQDGDLDLVVAGRGVALSLPRVSLAVLENVGGRGFTVRVVLSVSEAIVIEDIAHGDVDGDGDVDLLLAGDRNGSGPGAFLLVNDGRGGLSDVSAARLPGHLQGSTSAELSDLDGDGDLDAVVGGDVCVLLVNDGAGTFVDETAARAAALIVLRPRAVRAADVDADGDVDLVGTGVDRGALMRNEGGGTFRYARFAFPRTGTELVPGPHDVVLADFDGSGVDDVLFVRTPRCRLLLDRRDLSYLDASRSSVPLPFGIGLRYPGRGHQLRVADLDGDGSPEALVARDGVAVCSNDGYGGFGSANQLVHRSGSSNDIQVADFDRDGWPDVFIADFPSALARNQGGGRFVVVDLSIGVASYVAVADFDGDGWLDLYCHDHPGKIWRNDQSGGFVDVTGSGVHPGYTVAGSCAADFDGDADTDVLIAPYSAFGAVLVLARNDGAAGFVAVSAAAGPLPGQLIRLCPADLDGDGDVDFMAILDPGHGPYLGTNDGSGSFTVRPAFSGPSGSVGLITATVPADFDDDGDLDVAVTTSGGRVLYLENDGSGGFVERPDVVPFVPYDYGYEVEDAGDIDGDGDVDLVIADSARTTVLLNDRRGLDVPFLPEPGRPWAMDVLHADPGVGPPRFGMVAVGSRGTRIDVPSIGVWRVDPARSVLLPPRFSPGTPGTVRFTVNVPNDPALSWAEVFTQAVEVEVGGTVRLTNARLDRVR